MNNEYRETAELAISHDNLWQEIFYFEDNIRECYR
jgi:hypothetical protein